MSLHPVPNILIPLYDDKDQFRLSNLINCLILFDTVTINSRHLEELKILTNIFGIRNVKRLIKSGRIKLKGGHVTTGIQLLKIVGNDYLFLVRPMQLAPKPTREKSIEELTEYINTTKDHNRPLSVIRNKYFDYNRNKLITSINEAYQDYSDEIFSEFTNKVHGIIEKNSITRDGIIQYLYKDYLESDVKNQIQIIREEKEIFRINFSAAPTSQNEVNMLKGSSTSFLLGMGNIIRNNVNMVNFNSLIGFKNDEINFQKLNSQYLYNKFDPDNHLDRFNRVLTANDIPYLSEESAHKINFKKLYKAINSKEIAQFRGWLWNIDNLEDDEIEEKVNSITKYLDKIYRVPIINKSFSVLQSFLASSLTGDPIGVTGEVTDSVIEKYIFEKIKRKDHFTFINDIYPSIFEK
ncbi:MAG: hypothetical protein MK198_03745 [Gracilimonas sp.]|uniref:hypothetical protein n=1 Tax=Gracilimonas sp. TaxID=1974203 RepID=UPI003752A34A|nr:hypothetical protein [Gracilimonas sp.]